MSLVADRGTPPDPLPGLGRWSFRVHVPIHLENDHAVLIVEDDADLREMMVLLLKTQGVRVHTVANGREALDYLQRGHCPSLILLDLMMPVMNGWEFLREQQRHPFFAGVPVIVLSAVGSAEAVEFRNVEFFQKPLDFDRLLDRVGHHCAAH
jgi:CheY-like chemotaxis protein